MKLCKVCGKETNVIFNINLKRTSICESCANSISWQQVESLIREKNCKILHDEITKDLPPPGYEIGTDGKLVPYENCE